MCHPSNAEVDFVPTNVPRNHHCGSIGRSTRRFSDRQHRTVVQHGDGTALVQIGSKHGTPVTLNIADTAGGVMVTMSRGRNWLDRTADAGELFERAAAGNPISLLVAIPDVIGELRKRNLAPQIWNAVNEICSLSRALAGEEGFSGNPIVCPYCQTPNPPGSRTCNSCGGALPIDLPRICPKCGRSHTSEALFCQACGTRLVEG